MAPIRTITPGRAGALLAFVLLPAAVFCQSALWRWALAPAGNGTATALCADPAGNALLCGHFTATLAFGTDTLSDAMGAYQEVFIAKYNPAGQALWAHQALGYAEAAALCADAAGNVYLCGNFYGDSLAFGDTTLRNPSPLLQPANAFLAKYNAAGQLLWAKNLGGGSSNLCTALGADTAGNTYICGTFSGDSMGLDHCSVAHIGSNDIFMLKLGPAGTALWLRNAGGSFQQAPTALCAGPAGGLTVCGYFLSSALTVNAGSGSTRLSSAYANNIFVLHYDANGRLQWSETGGGSNANMPAGLAADAQGNVYFTGYFADSLALPPDTLADFGNQDLFIAKFDIGGNVAWAAHSSGAYAIPSAIATDSAGNSYVCGSFGGDTLFLDSSTFTLPPAGYPVFIAAYNADGSPRWAASAQGSATVQPVAAAACSKGLYLTGNFAGGQVLFGHDTFSQPPSTMYLALLGSVFPAGLRQGSAIPQPGVSVYPNPSAGIFYFNTGSASGGLQVLDVYGRTVYALGPEGPFFEADLSALPAGVYLYRLSRKGSAATGKLVKQ